MNLDFNSDNKSLEIELKNSVLNGSVKRQFQSINKKTLKMEQNQQVVQDPRLINKEQEEEIDYLHPCMQSQLMPESEEEMENIETAEEKSQDISPPKDSIIKRHRAKYAATRTKYSPTRIKSRNFLSNIRYTGINKSDFYNENFILDASFFLLKI